MTSGPICDIHMLTIERKSRFGENKEVLNVPHGYKMISHQLPFGYLIFRKGTVVSLTQSKTKWNKISRQS